MIFQLNHKLKLWWILNAYPEEYLYDKSIALLDLLSQLNLQHYHTHTACVYPVTVCYPKLSIYAEKFQLLTYWMEEKKVVDRQWFVYEVNEISLENFLTSQRETYSDHVTEIQNYVTILKAYFTALKHIQLNQDEERLYYLRMLAGFNTHLETLTLSLIRYFLR